jgi:hypothetical protein
VTLNPHITGCVVAGIAVPTAVGGEAVLMEVFADIGSGINRHAYKINVYVDLVDMDVTLSIGSGQSKIVPIPQP